MKNKISVLILSLVVQGFLVISVALVIYVDAVVFAHGTPEYSLTELTQEGILLVSAAIFLALSKIYPKSRGFLIVMGGFFTVMLIREADGFFDQINHGFWVYPAILVTALTLFFVYRFRDTFSAPMTKCFETIPFVYITVGLMIVILFSRIFGIWCLSSRKLPLVHEF